MTKFISLSVGSKGKSSLTHEDTTDDDDDDDEDEVEKNAAPSTTAATTTLKTDLSIETVEVEGVRWPTDATPIILKSPSFIAKEDDDQQLAPPG